MHLSQTKESRMIARNVARKAKGSTKVAALVAAAGVLALGLLPSGECQAASKDECIEAHGRGQDLREKGLLTRSRQMFLTCAQSSCPNLIQGDCARFGEELDRLLPSVSFGARDSRASDLPNTSVYVDETLVTTRLDDGKSYDFDPGKHTIRYVHDGKETTLKVILNQGEKGRTLVATFTDNNSTAAGADARSSPPEPKKSLLPLVVAGLGGAALATGGVLFAVGMGQVPEGCSVSTKECAAPPGDPRLDDANRGVSLANLGVGIGLSGAALLIGGLVWYAATPATPPSTRGQLVLPWVGRGAGGVAVVRSF
jgi:hypothetical protein